MEAILISEREVMMEMMRRTRRRRTTRTRMSQVHFITPGRILEP